MKHVKLVHNKNAGDQQFGKKDLLALMEKNGYHCEYSSTKDVDWKELPPHMDMVAVAGGDGTVRKMAKHLLTRKLHHKQFPVGVIPMGTANNISKTLELHGQPVEEIMSSWKNRNTKAFDVGSINGLDKTCLFLESFGFGLFPYLMLEMEKLKLPSSMPAQQQLTTALQVLLRIVNTYEAKACSLFIDGEDYSGKYIMAEVMNTKSIGPNLLLCPDSDPGDGTFEVVVIAEEDREKLAAYLQEKINGNDPEYDFNPVKATQVEISWDGRHVHVDDEILRPAKKKKMNIALRPGLISFLV